MLCMREGASLLLVVSFLWFYDLLGLYGRKFLGHDMQRNHLDMS